MAAEDWGVGFVVGTVVVATGITLALGFLNSFSGNQDIREDTVEVENLLTDIRSKCRDSFGVTSSTKPIRIQKFVLKKGELTLKKQPNYQLELSFPRATKPRTYWIDGGSLNPSTFTAPVPSCKYSFSIKNQGDKVVESGRYKVNVKEIGAQKPPSIDIVFKQKDGN